MYIACNVHGHHGYINSSLNIHATTEEHLKRIYIYIYIYIFVLCKPTTHAPDNKNIQYILKKLCAMYFVGGY